MRPLGSLFLYMWEERKYRQNITSEDLIQFHLIVKETDLYISIPNPQVSSSSIKKNLPFALSDIRELKLIVEKEVISLRKDIEEYIKKYPFFETTLEPWRQPNNLGQSLNRHLPLMKTEESTSTKSFSLLYSGNEPFLGNSNTKVEYKNHTIIEPNLYKNDSSNLFSTKQKGISEIPEVVLSMIKASSIAGVGPMASVAGAIAEAIGKKILEYVDEVIVENGGDIFIKTLKKRKVGIYAGKSPLSGKISITINPIDTPLGICTSSGKVGPSLSFGKTDATTILSPDTALADAVATAVGNVVKTAKDIEKGLELAKSIKCVSGALIIIEDKIGIWGNVTLAE